MYRYIVWIAASVCKFQNSRRLCWLFVVSKVKSNFMINNCTEIVHVDFRANAMKLILKYASSHVGWMCCIQCSSFNFLLFLLIYFVLEIPHNMNYFMYLHKTKEVPAKSDKILSLCWNVSSHDKHTHKKQETKQRRYTGCINRSCTNSIYWFYWLIKE